ncbi:Diguanylate cyclase (GGDEF) domain-containing protein [Pseudomonas sp. 8Z]|uniref:putative bifunctional diguanylate cyclase/phosphodiesterase n=1 Tax=Pseudomonas sp. 8Z TaxID=2653166 RepID=UPI0012F44332|nr:EAL domain-containing response regulator [Pseudomonas sp. 8Z]VXC57181.1 Diguanylate cyclase (GGDEF) domain-containing protein [Pseudomonas sp. 8Z]
MAENRFDPTPVILIVDDQTNDVRILQEAVGELAQVHVADDGRMALEVARFCRPDVVLLDIEMPGMSGFELCRLIKADAKLCDAAILFVSAHTHTENEIQALEQGGIDFIQKPLSIPVARAHVRAHLNLRAEAKRLAYFDALTGLPNHMLLRDRVEQMLQKARRSKSRLALLLLDLDNFKGINDSLGHSTGDLILKEVSQRLSTASRGVDTVSRQGGDEFVILVTDLQRSENISDYVQRLLEIIALPMNIAGNRFDLSACIGISVFPDDGEDLEALYRQADAAMYQAKQEGRNRYRFFSQSIESDARARHLLESHMRSALESGVFEVFYQLRFDVRHAQSRGMEALIRWRRDSGELVSPAAFIPLAEETGLIIPIGKQVLHKACSDAKTLLDRGQRLCVGVNISVVQFREESFLDMVKGVLKETALPPELLELEITEGVLARDIDQARSLLEALKQMGVRIAIDDFGTGYSSLSYLKKLPIDVLKIDQSFVRDMLTDHSDAAIIEAIVRMGQALDLELVAEGVENLEQAEKLLALGCELMQGFYYCRPMPFEQLCACLGLTSAREHQ